jgi:hypothetical protein
MSGSSGTRSGRCSCLLLLFRSSHGGSHPWIQLLLFRDTGGFRYHGWQLRRRLEGARSGICSRTRCRSLRRRWCAQASIRGRSLWLNSGGSGHGDALELILHPGVRLARRCVHSRTLHWFLPNRWRHGLRSGGSGPCCWNPGCGSSLPQS